MPRTTSVGTLDPDTKLLHLREEEKIDIITVNETKCKILHYSFMCVYI